MRISDVNFADATKYAEEAVAAGVMETAGDDAFLIATSSSTTPYGWLSAWGETYMSEAMQSVLVGYEDPRLPIFSISRLMSHIIVIIEVHAMV